MDNKKIKNATPKEFNGITFRSKLEARVAEILTLEKIPYKYEELKFELLPKLRYNEKSYRAVHYTPDFICGNHIIEVKGFPNDRWGLVKKLFLHKIVNEKLPYSFHEVKTITELKQLINIIKNERC